jgi:hypothetical protein
MLNLMPVPAVKFPSSRELHSLQVFCNAVQEIFEVATRLGAGGRVSGRGEKFKGENREGEGHGFSPKRPDAVSQLFQGPHYVCGSTRRTAEQCHLLLLGSSSLRGSLARSLVMMSLPVVDHRPFHEVLFLRQTARKEFVQERVGLLWVHGFRSIIAKDGGD